MARVSVIIPTHNRAALVCGAIESALRQPGLEMDVIVVDDGSMDGTPETLRGYGDRIRCLRQDNRGQAAARNAGFAAARGEHVVFLDSDDALAPGVLRRAVDLLGARAEADAVYGRTVNVDPAGRVLGEWRVPGVSGDIFPAVVQGRTLAVGSYVLRRTSLNGRPPFNPATRFGDEVEFLLWYARRHRFAFLPEPFLRRTIHPATLTRQAPRGDIVARRVGWIRELFGPEAVRIERSYLTPRVLADWYRSDGLERAAAGDTTEAIRCIRRSLRRWPWQWDLYAWLAYRSLPSAARGALRAVRNGRQETRHA